MYVDQPQLGQWAEVAKVGVQVVGGLLKSKAKAKARKKAQKKAAKLAAQQAAAMQAAGTQTAGFGDLPPWVLYAGLGLAAVFVVPKLLRRARA